MASGPDPDAALVVLHRFGFGARPGDVAKAAADPRGILRSELKQPDVALISLDDAAAADLQGTTPAIQASMAQAHRHQLASRREAAAALPPAQPATMAAPPAVALQMGPEGRAATSLGDKPRAAEPSIDHRLFRAEARARFDKMAAAEVGFVERLVRFWSNHFCVSVAKDGLVRAAAGGFEREAIRPFVLGRFVDMLGAVERHPAMLFYLDNQQSIGPDSRAGQHGKRGLNENLAREILELHTLGVGGGYGQADVTAFARILTGWMMAGRDGRLGEPGSFVFNANAHQPGGEILLGKTYPELGMGQGEAALDDIASHPSTALHIAAKLVRHFIADAPPPAAVERLAKVFRDKEGDLRALSHALVDLPEAWNTPLAKLRSPYDYVSAARRALHPEALPDPGPMLGQLAALGEPLWQPPGPNGFPDISAAWTSPEGMKVRLDIAWQTARQVKDLGSPSDLLDALIGPAASPETRQAIARAESKQQGLALLLMSPEFQRR